VKDIKINFIQKTFRNGLQTKIQCLEKLTGHHQFDKSCTWSTYQARQMKEFERKLHDDGIPMKVETQQR